MFAKKVWLNLILLLLIILLALIAYLEPGNESDDTLPQLLSLPPGQVNTIRLEPSADHHIDLARESGGWVIVEPIRVAANSYRVETILALVQAASYADYPAADQPLASFGLGPPRSRVRLNDVTIAFGDSEPLHKRCYVQVGDQVHLIDDRYFYATQLLLTALVDTALVPANAMPARIRLPDGVLHEIHGDWRLEPAEADVSMDELNGLVDEWRHARAMQVSTYQGDTAESMIDIAFTDGSHIELELLARSPELILGRRDLGLRYHFTAEQAERLLRLPASAAADSGSAD